MSGLEKVLLDRLCCTTYLHGTAYYVKQMKGKVAAVIVTQEERFEVTRHILGTTELILEYELCQRVDLGYVQAVDGSRGPAIRNELGQKFARSKS